MTCQRPAPAARCFVSAAVDDRIASTQAQIASPELAWLFGNCFPNTLDTTVRFSEGPDGPDTFVITGDIPAMWLRDSSAQVWPYLPLVPEDPKLARMFEGLVRRQVKCVLIDAYANAFNEGPTGSEWNSDLTEMQPELHERKWEVDSLCYVIRLSYGYWKAAPKAACFDWGWRAAMLRIVETFEVQQRKDGPGPYTFMRSSAVSTETAPQRGLGNPTRPVGLIHSMFRPSDDACVFPFLVPSNFFAATSLCQLAEMLDALYPADSLSDRARSLAREVEGAINQYAVHDHPEFGAVFAYEVDGLGSRIFMDDANVPSLLALPYLGCIQTTNDTYRHTRKLVLSEFNPYYRRGPFAEGIGGPHIGRDYIWPMSITLRALTAADEAEIAQCLTMLVRTHGGTGFMHESFHVQNPNDFTRSWFAWANTLFGELIVKLALEHPGLLQTFS